MAKVHYQANKGIRREPMALCSTRMNAKGNVEDNGRRSYVGMSSPIVMPDVFKATPAADRCAHCCDRLLEVRNFLRKRDGKPPIKAYNEGWENP